MPTPCNARNWNNVNGLSQLTPLPTPAATLDLLVSAVTFPMDAATTPYCGCGRLFDSCTSLTPFNVLAPYDALSVRYLGVIVAPGAFAAVGAIGKTTALSDGSKPEIENHISMTASGGGYGVGFEDLTVTASGKPAQVHEYTFGFGWFTAPSILVTGSAGYNAAPTAPIDRKYVLTSQLTPYVEPMMVTRAASFSVCVTNQAPDLEVL